MPTETSGKDILWSASLPPAGLAERVQAAAAAGFRGISVTPLDADQDRTGEVSPAASRRLRAGDAARWAADQGVALATLDSVIEWYPHEPPKRSIGDSHDVDAVLLACDRLGVGSLSALAPYPTTAQLDDLAEAFAGLCERAAGHGLLVHLEFTPFPPVPDLATAWEVVRRAGRHNGGILLDTWHFFRGVPDLELLTHIPGDRIMAVQLSDGALAFEESLIKDTFRHRRLPGEGTFDLPAVVSVLEAIGGLNRVGPEVLSEELFALPVRDAALRMAQATEALFASGAAR